MAEEMNDMNREEMEELNAEAQADNAGEMNEVDHREFAEGDRVTATVEKVEDKSVTVSIDGAPFDGVVPISELSSLHIEKASDAVKEGDRIDLVITKVEEGNYVLSKRRADAESAWDDLVEKFEAGEIIEAEIKEVVKGGLVVDLGVRGFIPASMVEDHFVESFEDYKGRTMSFKIMEMEKEKNRLILSHRAVAEQEKAGKKQELLESLRAGDVLDGTIQRIASFGAFVDIGGADGLVHISQLSHEHVEKVEDAVKVGDKVKVKVLSVDPENERISLSVKETLPGPWETVAEKMPIGSTQKGIVRRLVNFGAFVKVLPGIEGLVHISQISNSHIGTPQEVLKEGQEVDVKVLDVNQDEHRLSLSIKALLKEEDAGNYGSYGDFTEYASEDDGGGFSIGDAIGDKLKNFKG